MQNLKNISKKLSKIWKKVYIVWWWCREKYLNWKYNGDIDLATDAKPEEISMFLNVIKEVGKKYWTLIILEWNEISGRESEWRHWTGEGRGFTTRGLLFEKKRGIMRKNYAQTRLFLYVVYKARAISRRACCRLIV